MFQSVATDVDGCEQRELAPFVDDDREAIIGELVPAAFSQRRDQATRLVFRIDGAEVDTLRQEIAVVAPDLLPAGDGVGLAVGLEGRLRRDLLDLRDGPQTQPFLEPVERAARILIRETLILQSVVDRADPDALVRDELLRTAGLPRSRGVGTAL